MTTCEYVNHFLALTERAIEEGIRDSLKRLPRQEQEHEQDTAA